MPLEEKILELISNKREGDYWDFKAKHHEKAGNLIKDILCLANSVRHNGDRYIIFGVENDTCKIKGVPSEDRQTQADIINTLGNAGFAGNLYPDVFLREIELNGKTLDVLIIKDKPEKPYYLQRDYNIKGVRINPGTIYTRVRDANTPTDQVASTSDIEKMWRERFGLDNNPFERLQIYLLDFHNWEEVEENNWYYKPFPEFTIQQTDEDPKKVEGVDAWVRAAINPNSFITGFLCKYHQTILKNTSGIYFDEMRNLIPYPNIKIYGTRGDYSYFHSFSAGTFDFILLQFLTKKNSDVYLNSDQPFKTRSYHVPIIVFQDENQENQFLDYFISVRGKSKYSLKT